MDSDQRTTLILPVENQVRELDAKLLLACVAAERGFRVVFGSRAPIHYAVSSIPRGVYMAKSMRRLSDRMFSILRQLGHEIVAWDEEALVHLNDTSFYYGRRLSPRALRQVSRLFAWGQENAELFRRYPQYDGTPIHVTGNPRMDLLRPELRGYFADEVQQIRHRFDRILLVNTNFGWSNHFLSGFRMDENEGKPNNDFEERLAAHKRVLFRSFQEMIAPIAESAPELTLLIRPHPTENPQMWRDLAKDLPNVVVSNEGSVVPWLMACEAMIHSGCTTAVESAVIGTPAIAYQPVSDEDLDDQLPNTLSHQVSGLDQLLEKVRAAADGELGVAESPERDRIIEENIAGLHGAFACDRMIDVLVKAGYASRRPPRPGWPRYLQGWIHNRVRTSAKRFNERRQGHRNSRAFHDHRYPELPIAEIRARISRLGAGLNRFADVAVEPLTDHLFRIESRRPV